MKTLYSRIFLTFVAVFFFSLVTSSIIGLTAFKKTINEVGQNDMVEAGEKMREMYQQYHPEKVDEFMQQMAELSTYPIHLYNEKEVATFYSLNNNNVVLITNQAVKKVLSGQTYRSNWRKEETFVGVPIQIEGENYAMFLQYSFQNEQITNYLLLFILVLAFIIGSLVMVLAGRYLVKPLRELNQATKKLATGDFDTVVQIDRHDEIGELATSFNEMGDELKQLEEMRQDFVANVSHEIQTPLTSISGFAKALKNTDLIAEENRQYYLDIIIDESSRLSRLGDNLLKLASLDSRKKLFESSRFNLVEQIKEVVVALEPQWQSKKIQVKVIASQAVYVTGDPDLMKQIWLNLIANSLKFTPEDGTIELVILEKENNVHIAVKDTGMGISESELKAVFERFYKADKSRRTDQEGNGLGLSIVQRIVELHHGTITISSEVGHGTLIQIIFPENSL